MTRRIANFIRILLTISITGGMMKIANDVCRAVLSFARDC